MDRIRRATAQVRNVALDIRYCGRPLRDLRSTSGISDSAFAPHSADYQTLRQILRKFPINQDDVFTDVGCGHGRVLIEAARQSPGAQVVGVEIDPRVAATAHAVSRRYPNITVIDGAAPEAMPAETTYAFMFNPFPGSVVLDVLAKLARQPRGFRRRQAVLVRPTDLELICDSPLARDVFTTRHYVLQGVRLMKGRDLDILHFQLPA